MTREPAWCPAKPAPDDQVVLVASSMLSARIIKDIYYPAAPHGITATHQDQVNADMLAFLQN